MIVGLILLKVILQGHITMPGYTLLKLINCIMTSSEAVLPNLQHDKKNI